MIKIIRKFSGLTKSQKTHIIVFLLFMSFMPTKSFLEWKGRDFPQKSEINYSTGVLDYLRTTGKDSKSFTVLRSIEGSSQDTVFGCSYTAFISSTTGSCISRNKVESYLGKQATVGWYYQPSFLGFKNNMPQLVSLEVNGKHLKTYEETVNKNKRKNKIFSFVYLFFTIIFTVIFIFVIYPKDFIYKEK
ncbi:hypothetical protein [Psychrobacter sp. UBA3480]|uniref:hypothetical protein n=1 Tax=Psychrobacter sp. UBA3480 TaxID=1947350 RepID=UPI0025F916A1|nr:hypothetical protein [Psychrobacter sp. UBA3480]